MYEATSENIDISWTDSPMGPPDDDDDLATLVGVTILALAILILIIL